MEIILDKKELSQKLNMLTKIPKTKKTALELVNHVFFEADRNQINIMVYNGYDTFVTTSILGKEETDLKSLLFNTELKLLSAITSKLESDVAFKLTDKYFNVSSEGSRFELFRVDLADMWTNTMKPELGEKFNMYKVNQRRLKEIFDRVVVSTSEDKENDVLSSIRISVCRDKIELISTDGYRASVVEEKLECVREEVEIDDFLLTRDVVSVLNSVLKSDEQMYLKISGKAICFETGDISVCVKTKSTDKYPDVKRILLAESEEVVGVSRKDWLGAIDGIANLGANLVQLVSDKGSDKVKVIGECDIVQEYYVSGEIEIDLDRKMGKSLDMIFRNKMLLEGIKSMNEDKIEIRSKGANDFITIRPEKVTDRVYIVLPCRSKKN